MTTGMGSDATPRPSIRSIVGTGSPFDAIFIIPLVHQWGAARACSIASRPDCERPIGRIVVLDEPGITGNNGVTSSVLAFCETDYQTFRDALDPATTEPKEPE